MPCFLSCKSKSVLAKPLEPQCSRVTVSPGWGSNSLRISPPHVPYSNAMLNHVLFRMGVRHTSTSHSRRDGSDDAADRKHEVSPRAPHSGLGPYWEHNDSLRPQSSGEARICHLGNKIIVRTDDEKGSDLFDKL